MEMKLWIFVVSVSALLCAFACIAWSGTGGAFLLAIGTGGAVLLAIGLALAAGILSAVNADRLQHPGWSGLLALLTVGGVVSVCSGVAIVWGSPEPESLDIVQVIALLTLAPAVVLPLLALLSSFLLRPRVPRPAGAHRTTGWHRVTLRRR